jgi:hypothetical protein
VKIIKCEQSHSSVKRYKASVTDLYKQQVAMGMNNYAHPNAEGASNLLLALRAVQEKQAKLAFEDKGKG